MNVLITSAGQRVALVRAFSIELKKRFPEAKVFTTDMVPELSAACNVSDKYFKVKRVTDPSYIDDLITICKNQDIKMIVPTIDTELLVLSQNQERFHEHEIHTMVSSFDFVRRGSTYLRNSFALATVVTILLLIMRELAMLESIDFLCGAVLPK
jgi:carbamoyl-phosphate synthase large subunit